MRGLSCQGHDPLDRDHTDSPHRPWWRDPATTVHFARPSIDLLKHFRPPSNTARGCCGRLISLAAMRQDGEQGRRRRFVRFSPIAAPLSREQATRQPAPENTGFRLGPPTDEELGRLKPPDVTDQAQRATTSCGHHADRLRSPHRPSRACDRQGRGGRVSDPVGNTLCAEPCVGLVLLVAAAYIAGTRRRPPRHGTVQPRTPPSRRKS
jgi:hypothetical protein